MPSLILHDPEVRRVLDQGTVLVVRPVMPQPPEGSEIIGPEMYAPCHEDSDGELHDGKPIFGVYDSDGEWGTRCPFGAPGSTRWVRECWGELIDEFTTPQDRTITYRADGAAMWQPLGMASDYNPLDHDDPPKWRSATHMPRVVSRLTFKLLAVRAAAVQGITIDDIYNLGCPPISSDEDASELYEWAADLWDARYANRRDKQGNRPYAWDANPMVWMGHFEVVK